MPVTALTADSWVTLLILQTSPQAPTASAPSGSSLSLRILPCIIRVMAGHPRGWCTPIFSHTQAPCHWTGAWLDRSLEQPQPSRRSEGHGWRARDLAEPSWLPREAVLPLSTRRSPRRREAHARTQRPGAAVWGRPLSLPGLGPSPSRGRQAGEAPCTGCACRRCRGSVATTSDLYPRHAASSSWGFPPAPPRSPASRLPLAAARRPRAPSWLQAEPL